MNWGLRIQRAEKLVKDCDFQVVGSLFKVSLYFQSFFSILIIFYMF